MLAVELVVVPVVGRKVKAGKHGPKSLFSPHQVLDRSGGPCSRIREMRSCLAMKRAAPEAGCRGMLLWTKSLIIAALRRGRLVNL